MSDWHVYLLRCSDKSLYAGITLDLERRLDEHNNHNKLAAAYTRARRPVKLVYSEVCRDRSHAGQREAAIKKMTKQQKEKLVKQNQ